MRRIGGVRTIATFGPLRVAAQLVPGDGQVDEISQTPSPFGNLMPPAGDSLDQLRDAAKAREHRPLRSLDALGKRNLLLAGERSGVAHLTEVSIDQAAREGRAILRRHRIHAGKLVAVHVRPIRALAYDGTNKWGRRRARARVSASGAVHAGRTQRAQRAPGPYSVVA